MLALSSDSDYFGTYELFASRKTISVEPILGDDADPTETARLRDFANPLAVISPDQLSENLIGIRSIEVDEGRGYIRIGKLFRDNASSTLGL